MDSCLECMAAAQIDFLHLELVVDASRLAYWLGKPVDASRESEKMAPSKLTHRKYFPYSCFFFVYLLRCCFKTFP